MRFIVMHKTSAHWEAGARPTPELIASVGGLLGELSEAGRLLAAEGLRPSAEGVRVTCSSDARRVVDGPFERGGGSPSGFSIVRAASIEDAVAWAAEHAGVRGGSEVDIRPVTEPWDIGLGHKPPELRTRRYMVLRTGPNDADVARSRPAPPIAAELLVTETMRASARGRRYKHSDGRVMVVDGPFTESKELIGGYVILAVESLDAAEPWVRRYMAVVAADEVDVHELE